MAELRQGKELGDLGHLLRDIVGVNRLNGQLHRDLNVVGRREEDAVDNDRAVGGISGAHIRLIIPEGTRRLDVSVSGAGVKERHSREKREYSEPELKTRA